MIKNNQITPSTFTDTTLILQSNKDELNKAGLRLEQYLSYVDNCGNCDGQTFCQTGSCMQAICQLCETCQVCQTCQTCQADDCMSMKITYDCHYNCNDNSE